MAELYSQLRYHGNMWVKLGMHAVRASRYRNRVSVDIPYEMNKKIVLPPNNELNAAAGPNCTNPTMSATTTLNTIPQTGSPSRT